MFCLLVREIYVHGYNQLERKSLTDFAQKCRRSVFAKCGLGSACFQIINRILIIRKPMLYSIRTLWWWGCGKSTGEDNNNEDLGGKINKRKGKSENIVSKTRGKNI